MTGIVFTQLGLALMAAGTAGLALGGGRLAVATIAAGVLLVTCGWLWPAPERRARTAARGIDRFAPVWAFDERHETTVAAPPAAVHDAILRVTAREVRLLGLLTWIRRGGRPMATNILAPDPDRPVFESAIAGGFRLLADEPGREVVAGVQVTGPRIADPWEPLDPLSQRAHRGRAVATIAFEIEPLGNGRCRLATETRIHATTPGARRAFAPYWRVIYPGSALIRRLWLRAIRLRAERSAARSGA